MTKKNKIIVVILIAGAFIAVLNQTTMNPAIPRVMHDLHIDAPTAQWLSSGFTLVNAIVIATSAFLMDKFSTRKLFIGSFVLFFVGSVLGGWGPNFPVLLVGRFLQAVTSGLMLPMAMTVLMIVFPKEKRGTAMGLYSLVIMFAPAIGPSISGILTDSIGWRAMFLIMAVASLFVIVFAFFELDNFGETKNVTLDVPSVAMSSAGLFALLYGFSKIGSTGTLIEAGVLIVVGAIILAFFARRQLKMETPFLQLRVLADKQFATGAIILMLVQASLAAAAIMLPLYLQNVRGMSATVSGIAMMPGAILGAFSGLFAGKIFDKIGARKLSIAGVILIALGSIGMACYSMTTLVITVIVFYSLRSMGLMMANTPLNSWSVANLPNDKLNHGNAVTSTLRQVSSTMCVGLMVSVMNLVASRNTTDPIAGQLDGVHWTFYLSLVIAAIALVMVLVKIKNVDVEPKTIPEFDMSFALNAKPYTVSDSDTIARVIEIFTANRTSGIPVINKAREMVGFISDGDVIRFLENNDAHLLSDEGVSIDILDSESFTTKASALMGMNVMAVANENPLTITHEMNLTQITKFFNQHKLNKVAVVEGKRLIGTISRVDLMQYLMTKLN
ncbi:MAG: DHA2 family efflux MFS transporter permease subunit [Lactobacillales bacterium]|jgi:EmrB/QacA subfamily drug resistance transporter|nr:DHA2 family efflux MFS transporter permease subunit [Lactobacillales bacterium]